MKKEGGDKIEKIQSKKQNLYPFYEKYSLDYVAEKNSEKPPLALGIPRNANFKKIEDDHPNNGKNKKRFMVVE